MVLFASAAKKNIYKLINYLLDFCDMTQSSLIMYLKFEKLVNHSYYKENVRYLLYKSRTEL